MNDPLPTDQAAAANAVLPPVSDAVESSEQPLYPPCPVCASNEIVFVPAPRSSKTAIAFIVIFAGFMTLGLFALYYKLTRPPPYRCTDCGKSFHGRRSKDPDRPLSMQAYISLVLVTCLTVIVAMLGRLLAAEIESMVSEKAINLPDFTTFVLATANDWLLLPVPLLLLFFWSLRPEVRPRQRRRMWLVAVLGCMVTIFLMMAAILILFVPLTLIPGGPAP